MSVKGWHAQLHMHPRSGGNAPSAGSQPPPRAPCLPVGVLRHCLHTDTVVASQRTTCSAPASGSPCGRRAHRLLAPCRELRQRWRQVSCGWRTRAPHPALHAPQPVADAICHTGSHEGHLVGTAAAGAGHCWGQGTSLADPLPPACTRTRAADPVAWAASMRALEAASSSQSAAGDGQLDAAIERATAAVDGEGRLHLAVALHLLLVLACQSRRLRAWLHPTPGALLRGQQVDLPP